MLGVIQEQGGEYEDCHPHEVLASLILRSAGVTQYLQQLSREYAGHALRLNGERASKWIVGQTPSETKDTLSYKYVINGPFDADKLDYIFRDAHYSGLPLGLDLYRLWSSCKENEEPNSRKRLLTLHQSSATPLEQILFNKINLFTVVYRHPKVRAAECMFQGVIELLRQRNMKINGRNLVKATDFLWLTDDVFFGEALKRCKDHDLHKMIHDILYRRLFVRALTISKDTVLSKGQPYHDLRSLNHNSMLQERRRVAELIWKKAGKPHTKHHVWIDLPPDPPTGEADSTYVRTASGELRKLSDLFPIQYWAQLYNNHKWRGHVFCPPSCQQEVYNASKSVLKEEFDLDFSKSAGQSSHVPRP